ncbi:hypothetical protein VULLAG_LOCUS19277 [Vulpes lagopus]
MEPRGSGASSQRNMRREGIQQVLEQGLWRLTTDWMQGPREMTATIRQTLGKLLLRSKHQGSYEAQRKATEDLEHVTS